MPTAIRRRASRPVAAFAVAVLALVVGVSLASPHDGHRMSAQASAERGSGAIEVLGHARPIGYSADVFAHRGYAYLSSWRGKACGAHGVRVYDVRDPRRPRRVATFGDAASDAAVSGTWTEKTIVKQVRTSRFRGALAVTSFQSCRDGAFRGFGLYDVTNPRRPRRLSLYPTEPRGSHEIWLQASRGRAYVYTAIPNSELLSSPEG